MILTVNDPTAPLHAATRSILEERPSRAPVSGKIRTGIKVLTSAAAKNPAALKIWQDGINAELTYDAIESKLKTACGFDRSPLTPRNTPYFRVSRNDFTMPELADRILALYGEDRGDGRQLYRFPIILPFDDTLMAMPHAMRSYSRSGLRFWSEYDAAGTRYCMKYPAAEIVTKNRRALKAWGGRKPQINTEFNACGHCDPEACPIYQSNECKLTGHLLFWIPGIPGSSLIQLDTTSIYSMKQMLAQMQLVGAARNGRLSKLHNGKPVFYLAKVESEVSQLVEGQPKKVKQFLTHLEADVNMLEVVEARDALPATIKAVGHVLTPPVVASEPQQATSNVSSDAGSKPVYAPEVAALRRKIFTTVMAAAIPQTSFLARCQQEWGEQWGASLDCLQAAYDVLPKSEADMPAFNAWLNKAPF